MIILIIHSGQSRSLFYIQLTKQCRDVICGLIKNKVELSICLVHLVSFQQAETSSSQQVVLF